MTKTDDDDLVQLLRETFADAERQATDQHRLPAMPGTPRRGRWLAIAAAASVAAVAISATLLGGPGPDEPIGGSTVTTTNQTPATAPGGGPGTGPTGGTMSGHVVADAKIYGAVMKAITVMDRPGAGWPVLFVLDAPRANAADGTFTDEPLAPIAPAIQQQIAAEIREVAPVRWVSKPNAAKQGGTACGQVLDGGAIVTLGEIHPAGGNRLDVRVSQWIGCAGAHWLTYRLERAGADWQITGTVGPQVIS
ncbi:hypothetical protein ACFPJ1_35205 [Kribbella qitaiheensis]|uniref:hypothetical protein n=1 Tax=Kribbella qitaiheensis TaxID=1544730 RepID=UPI0036175F1D